ncbi:MAG: Cdc6/Cdc18 family protein [Candidatus Bilamarchaeaceae archaeon]
MASFEEILSKKSIFKDLTVLSPHYVPDVLPFREKQIEEIMTIASSALKGQKPRNLFIYGKTGTGKTCSIKNIMSKFNTHDSNAVMVYINCRIYNSRYRILQKVLKQFMPELEKAGFGLPFFYENLLRIANSGTQIVLVLDEIDMTKDIDELIYMLSRANDELNTGGITIFGISNRIVFKNELDPRTKSSLYETEMNFPPYTANQLKFIIEQRTRMGFSENAVDESAVNLTAAITSQESGDARYALKLMMKAGEIASQKNKERVSDEDVEAARKRVEYDLIRETITTLPQHHQIFLYSIADLSLRGTKNTRLGEDDDSYLLSGEVYEGYSSNCSKLGIEPKSARWCNEYLNDLEMLGLIVKTMSGKGMRGRTTLIKLGNSPEDVKTILGEQLFKD